jgi:hypothetical protein
MKLLSKKTVQADIDLPPDDDQGMFSTYFCFKRIDDERLEETIKRYLYFVVQVETTS